jgi:ribosome-associated protein
VPPIRINRDVTIDDSELSLSFTRAGGPGGQHVNTSSTRVELRWDLPGSAALTDAQKELVAQRLASRLTADGMLVLHASEHRSQTRNREAAVARFAALLADALRMQPPRRATAPSASSRRRRLDAKRQRAQTKQLRKPPLP